jgi:hypothetical protein
MRIVARSLLDEGAGVRPIRQVVSMKTHRLGAWLLLSFLAWPASSRGQTTAEGLPLQVTAIEGPIGRRVNEDINRGINMLDCQNPTESWVEFTVLPGSTAITAVDVWVGIGAETCQTSASRTPPTQTCRRIGYVQIGSGMGSAPDPGNSRIAIGLDAVPSDEMFPFCTSTSPSTLNFFFVADVENFTGEASSLERNQWVNIGIRVDAGPPDAPLVESTTSAGDRQISVTWDRVTSGTELILYKVYVEKDGCDPAAASGVLVAGEPPPQDTTDIFVFDANQATSYAISTSTIGLELGESASVYITSMDMAYNESVLSEPICITRIPTAGFCAAWETAEGAECPGSCSAAGGSPASVLWISTLLALLTLVVYRRRSAR